MKSSLLLFLTVAAASASAQTGNPGGKVNDDLGDPDYGVCRGVNPRCFHAWSRTPTTLYRVLLYTRTAGPRHAALGKPLGGGLNPPLDASNVIQREMLRLASANGWTLDYTEDVSEMTALSGYNAVVFISTSRDNLDDAAKTALRQYMRAGGGFVGVHNAFGTLYNWPYYEGLLGNANFYDHGPERDADVILRSTDASTAGIAKKWRFRDEWYNLVPFPTRVKFLATVEETSYGSAADRPPEGSRKGPDARAPGTPPAFRAPRLASVVGRSPGHGSFHPVAWCQYYDGGKAWLTTLGHDAKAYEATREMPGSREFQAMLVGGIKSVMGLQPFCT